MSLVSQFQGDELKKFASSFKTLANFSKVRPHSKQGNMNEELIIEALEALIEKKESEINDMYEENHYYYQVWVNLVNYLAANGGRPAIIEATKDLDEKYKKKLDGYLNDLFD